METMAAGTSLSINNADFEYKTSILGIHQLKYWEGFSVNGGTGSVSLKKSQGVDSSYGVQISPTSGHYALKMSETVSVSPKTAYVATYYVKGLSDSSQIFLIVPQTDSAGNATAKNPYLELPLYTVSGKQNDYVEVKSYFRTEEDTAAIGLWFDTSGGDVLIDNVSVAEYTDEYLGNVEECNLGFEQTGGTGIKNWNAVNFDSVSAVSEVRYGGTQAVNLMGNSLKDVSYYNCQAGVPVKEPNTYRFTVFAKSRNSIGAKVFLTAMGVDKNRVVVESVKGAETLLSADDSYGEWTPVSVTYTPGAEVTNVHLSIGVTKCVATDLLVDDIHLLNLSEADYAEEFSSLSESGYPADWQTQGEATFSADGDTVTVEGAGAFVRRFTELRNSHTYEFTGNYTASTDSTAEIEITYYDYKNQMLDSYTKTLSESPFSFELETPSATYATIALKGCGGTVSYDRLQIRSVTADITPGAEWSSKWIWYSEKYSECVNQSRYFRDTFELAEKPSKCILQMTADDAAEYWVNGTKITADVSDGGVYKTDIAEYLTAGTNVFAFKVTNAGYECGLLYEAIPMDTAGNMLGLIVSDHSTRCTKVEPEAGWKTKDYVEGDDWQYAKEKGRPGVEPWGEIPYDATVQAISDLNLKKVSMEEQVQGGTMAKLTLKADVPSPFEKELLRWGDLCSAESGEKVCEVRLYLATPMKKWLVDQAYETEIYFEIPDFIPEGKYTLRFDKTSVAVMGDDFTDNQIVSFLVKQNTFENGVVNTSSVQSENGVVRLYVNGEEISPMFYYPPDGYSALRSDYVQKMKESGINLIPIMIGSGTNGAGKIWTGIDGNGNNIYDWSAYDKKIMKCIAANSQAKLMISFDASVPSWWLEQNPQEASYNADGTTDGASFASEKWRTDMKQVMGDLIDHITSQPYAKYIFGFRVTAGRTLEWLPWSDSILDKSEATNQAFRVWLTTKYGTDSGLQSAWNDTSVTLATASQPEAGKAKATVYQTLLDTGTQMQVIDYHKFLAETTADALIELCGAAKEKTDNKWITGGYFGYIWNAYSYTANGTLSLAVSKVLQSDAVDYLCGPLCYDERQQGESAPFQSMVDSLNANGKLWIAENDIRTVAYQTPYTEEEASAHGQNYTMSDTRSALIREFSNELTKGAGLWWYDMSGGWFNDEQMYELLSVMQEEMTVNLSRSRTSASEVAVFVDEDVYAYTAYEFGPVYNWLYGTNLLQRQQLATMGAPYDTYYLSDLEKGKVPENYKVNIILNAVELDESEKTAIETYLKKDNKTILWLNLPGFSNGTTMNVSNIQTVTGFANLSLITEKSSGDCVLQSGSAYTQGVEGKTYGIREYNSGLPVVSIGDTGASVLGTYSDGNGTSLAVKNMGTWTSIYSAVPELPAQLLTNILKQAGVHVYSDDRDDIVYANGEYLAIHCRYGGEKTLTLPQNYSVYDVFNGKTISQNTNTITMNAEENSTTLFRLTQADTVTVSAYVKGSGGSVSPAGMQELTPGSDCQITYTPDAGYQLASVFINGQKTEVANSIVTLSNVQENMQVTAVFEKVLPKEEERVNLLQNCDFEDIGEVVPDGWEGFNVNNGSGSYSLVTDAGHAGMAVKISPDLGNDVKQYCIRPEGGDAYLTLNPSTEYTLSFDVKCLSDTAYIMPTIRQLSDGGRENSNQHPWYELTEYKVTGTNGEWKKVECTFTTDSNTSNGNIWMTAGAGDVLLDNLSLSTVEIPNADFETFEAGSTPKYWEAFAIDSGSGSISLVAGKETNYSAATKITPSEGAAYALRPEGGDALLSLRADTWYLLSYDVKCLSDSASFRPVIRQMTTLADGSLDNANTHPWYTLTQYEVKGTGGKWKKVYAYFKTDSNTTNGSIWLRAEGGAVLLDNVSLSVMGKEGNVPNSGFERLDDSKNIVGWEAFAVNEGVGSISVADGAGQDGIWAAQISPNEGKQFALRVAGGDAALDLESNAKYVLTYDIKTISDGASLFPTIRQLAKEGTENSNTHPWYELTEYKVTGTGNEWKSVRCEFRTDTDTTNGNIWFIAEGGSVFLDNVRLTCVEVPNAYKEISSYRTEANTAPQKKGYLFAGWYEDAECTQAVAAEKKSGSAYAKFVDEEVLNVKAQLRRGTTDTSENTDIRFITTVDSLDYQNVGFEIAIGGGEKKKISLTKVYKKLYASRDGAEVDTLVPSKNGSPISNYFTAYAYWNVPKSYFDTTFTITPYWTTLDGTMVYGTTVVKNIRMGLQ